MKLGSLNIVEGWRDGDGQTEVYKFVTKPDLDAYVPASLQKHFLKGSFQYVDIIRYDPRHIARSPYQLHVSSIPPILPDQVQCTQPLGTMLAMVNSTGVELPDPILCQHMPCLHYSADPVPAMCLSCRPSVHVC